jgi:hypothetical protein
LKQNESSIHQSKFFNVRRCLQKLEKLGGVSKVSPLKKKKKKVFNMLAHCSTNSLTILLKMQNDSYDSKLPIAIWQKP